MLRLDDGQRWAIVTGPNVPEATYGASGVTSLDRLVVGDFDGDGYADLARRVTNTIGIGQWRYASPGRFAWTALTPSTSSTFGPIGRFDADATSDAIIWSGRWFDYAPGGKGPVVRWSRQNMR